MKMSIMKDNFCCLLVILILSSITDFVRSETVNNDFVDPIHAAFFRDESNTSNLTCIPHDSKFTCDCGNADEKMILQPLDGHVWHISISNCKSLTIKSNLLINTHGIRSVSLMNIDSLVLEENAFAFPRDISNNPLKMEFYKVIIEEIQSHAINGNIEEITFSSSQIATVQPFGISALRDNAILLKFTDMLIDTIEPQAFKKFTVEQFEITNTIFTSNLPSKSFYEIEAINTFKITNCSFKNVHSRAFDFPVIGKLILTENHFNYVDGEWIHAKVQENILIKNNHFGILNSLAFSGISVHRNYVSNEKMELKFYNNSIIHEEAEVIPLKFNENFLLHVSNLYYLQKFDCIYKDKLLSNDFFKSYSDTIYLKVDDSSSTNEFSNVTKVLHVDCIEKSYIIYIIIGVVLLVILIIIIISILVYLRYKRNKNKQNLDIVIPEPRTYRETQIVLQIENAGLLKTDM